MNRLMMDLPDETVVQILAALPYLDIATSVVHVCRSWHELRVSKHLSAARAVVDERGLVVTGGFNDEGRWSRLCLVLVGGRWFERASLPYDFAGPSAAFCGQLILLGVMCDNSDGQWSPCYLAFNLEASAWHTLDWKGLAGYCTCCCTAGSVVVTLSHVDIEAGARIRILRPGSGEGWVPIPDPPVDVFTSDLTPGICCVGDVVYVVGGAGESGELSDALQDFNLSTRAWTVRAPMPEPRCDAACVQLAGRLYVLGGRGSGGALLASVCSYDPHTGRWRLESTLSLENDRGSSLSGPLNAVAHEGRVVVIGLTGSPSLALVGDVWTELPPPPPVDSATRMGRLASPPLR